MNPPGYLSYGALDLRRVLPCKRCGQHPKVAYAPWICEECKADPARVAMLKVRNRIYEERYRRRRAQA